MIKFYLLITQEVFLRVMVVPGTSTFVLDKKKHMKVKNTVLLNIFIMNDVKYYFLIYYMQKLLLKK